MLHLNEEKLICITTWSARRIDLAEKYRAFYLCKHFQRTDLQMEYKIIERWQFSTHRSIIMHYAVLR